MPNHITTIIEIEDEKDSKDPLVSTGKLAKAINGKNEDGTDHPFDFNKIIPMPGELRDTKSPTDITPDDQYEEELKKYNEKQEAWKKESPEERSKHFLNHPPISQSMSDDYIKRFGANNWYDWSVKNWGTKWNSYENTSDGKGSFTFETAWSHPDVIIEKLSKMFPTVTIYVQYADEDRGSNLGIYKMKNGEILEEADMKQVALQVLADKIWDGGIDINEQLNWEDEE